MTRLDASERALHAAGRGVRFRHSRVPPPGSSGSDAPARERTTTVDSLSSSCRTDGTGLPIGSPVMLAVQAFTPSDAAPMPGSRILVADDQPDVLTALSLLLKGHGYQVQLARSPAELLPAVASGEHDAVLMDLNYTRDTTSGREGLECLARLRTLDPEIPVVAMTAWGSLELAVEAMRRGASDFVLKPWDNGQLLETLGRVRRAQVGLASSVQRNLLPRGGPRLRSLEYAAECREAGPVGGDLYDFIAVDGGIAMVVADTSGKSVPAALLVAHLHGIIRSLSREARDPAALLRQVNACFLAFTGPEHYAM